MSLLDTGPETLVVHPAKWGVDDSGNERWLAWETGDPVFSITGAQVEPNQPTPGASGTILAGVNGQIVDYRCGVLFRALPAGLPHMRWSQISWDGQDWVMDGDVKSYRRGHRTRHYQFWMVKKGAKA